MKRQEISHKLGQKAFQLRKEKNQSTNLECPTKREFQKRKEERNYTPQMTYLFLPMQ